MFLSQKSNNLKQWIAFFFIALCFSKVNSLSQTCSLISPVQYKVKNGTSNFTFLLQMETKFVGDSTIRNCEFGIMIEDLVCVDFVQTICCCNSFTRKSSATCQIRSNITSDKKYLYQGVAQIQGSTGTICSGYVQIALQKDEPTQPQNLGMILAIVGGIVFLIVIGVIVYIKVIKKPKSMQFEQQPDKGGQSSKLKKSLIGSHSNSSTHKKGQSFTPNQSIHSNLYDKIDSKENAIIIVVPDKKHLKSTQQKFKLMAQKQKAQKQKAQKQKAEYERYLFERQREKRDYQEYLKFKQQKERQQAKKQNMKLQEKKFQEQKQQQLTDSLMAKHGHRSSFK